MSTWFITGCSSGLGRHLAEAVLVAGHRVVVTARNLTDVDDLLSRYPGHAYGLTLDVTDPAQIAAAVETSIERFGQIDVLVNNAGYGYRSAVEEAPTETAGKRRKENDTTNPSRGGDPAKAAEAMITAVESPNPPAILVLGAPTVDMFRAELDARRDELDAWEDVSSRTSV